MSLAHFVRGNGRDTVLMLHGYLGSGRNLASFATRWAEAEPSLRIVVADLPGHGHSPPLSNHPTLQELIDRVLEFCDEISPARALSIVGHSLGGRVALGAAFHSPKRIDQIVMLDISPDAYEVAGDLGLAAELLASAPDSADSRDELRQHFTSQGLSIALADWLLMGLAREGDQLRWRVDRQKLRALGLNTRSEDLWAMLAPIAHKCSVIYGERGGFVSEATRDRLLRAGVRVEGIAGSGHFVHVDAPDALLAAVRHILPGDKRHTIR